MIDIIKIHSSLLSGNMKLNELSQIKDDINIIAQSILSGRELDNEIIKKTIMVCLDYYTYNDSGDVLITDKMYDDIMNVWISSGNKPIIYPDNLPSYSTWPIKKHKNPGLVGSIGKIYTRDELINYVKKYQGVKNWIIAPKYDGVSAVIEYNNGIVSAMTRGDGYEGQDITQLIRYASNASDFHKHFKLYKKDMESNGFYKCEVCVSQENFKQLIEEKEYANRRSATTGIINTPKNIQLAKYLTLIPLYFEGNEMDIYAPWGMKIVKVPKNNIEGTVNIFEERIDDMLSDIRNSSFNYRTDGVILYPLELNLNPSDVMQDAIAFKVNTNEALTNVDYGYVSVGRLGNAVPMLKVKPVEVNETIVTDVSLGSFDKFARLDIHENETVLVYSAGDVIPQVKLPEHRQYDANAPYLKIKKRCPYCNEKLKRFGLEYKCINQECPRLITGKISNFIVKLGIENVSDRTIEVLYENGLIQNIPDIFKLNVDDIKEIRGFDTISANNIVSEIDKIRKKEMPISVFFGALGIPNISEKKCRNIFNYITIDDVYNNLKKKIMHKILDADNIGVKTAETFTDYIDENKNMIKELIGIMNIVVDTNYKGNVVFTGFRNPELEKKFNKLGYEVSSSVNSKTVAVISGDYNHNSTKCKTAMRKGISIVDLADVEELLEHLKGSIK